jgi:hypothetical protein
MATAARVRPTAALANPQVSSGAVPAPHTSEVEAEKAARLHFNGTGAHRMGPYWMPCEHQLAR